MKLDRKTMTAIRASLERKKVIADLALADAPMEEQDAAYEAFLADKAAKEEEAAAKAEGKKKWLHVLAREAFSRQLANEANEQPSDDTPAEAPTDTPTKSIAG